MLQLGWQFSSKYLIGGFGRSAKAGWAAEGVISNIRGKGKRSGGLVLPSWGPKRGRAAAWDLARVVNSIDNRPARQSGQPLQSQKRYRRRHANVDVPILGLGAFQLGRQLIGPTAAVELRGPAWVWHASTRHVSTWKWHASTNIGVASCPSIGRFRRSAKAGQATQGMIFNLRGKGNRRGTILFVLSWWGRMRARVPARALGGVTNSMSTQARLHIGRQLHERACTGGLSGLA